MSWTLLVGVVLVLGASLLAALARRAELVRMGRAVTEREQNERLAAGTELYEPAIDLSRCLGCGTCVSACPEDVLELVHGQAAVVHKSRCEGIAACERECPVGAVKVGVAGLEERDDIPALTGELEAVGLPGVFLAGEVTAQALIKTAVDHGTAVARVIASRLESDVDRVPGVTALASVTKRQNAAGELEEEPVAVAVDDGADEEVLDLVVVGAGPAGLACALEAKLHGLSVRLLEREALVGGTVARYPRKKLILTQPIDLPGYGSLDRKSYRKEELVALWDEIVSDAELEVACGEVLQGLDDPGDGAYDVVTDQRRHRARHVCIAIGRRGLPRQLGIPGEDLPKVAYGLMDAASYQDVHALVVGGGDSAVETALALAEQPGNTVTLSYRKEAFFRLRSRNADRLEEARLAGELEVVLRSEVTSVSEIAVTLEVDGRERHVENDHVFVQIGGTAPSELLERVGVSLDPAVRAARTAEEEAAEVADETEQQVGLATSLKAGFALAVACLAWAAWHLDYYALPLPARPAHELHLLLRPGLGFGLAFGVVAFLLVLANLAYLVRRSPVLPFQWGSLQAWMTSHVATGVFAVLCALLHAAMAPRNTVGGQAFFALVALLGTGAVGRWFYAWVPRAANGRELELDEVRRRLHVDDETWSDSERGFARETRERVVALIDARQWRGNFLGRLVAMIGLRFDLARALREIRSEGRSAGIDEDRIRESLALARHAHRLALSAGHYEDVRAVAGSWRYFHRWVAVLMVGLLAMHVFNAFSYSAFFGGGVG